MNKTVRDAIHRVFKDKAPQPCEVSGVTYYNPQDVGKALEYGDDGRDIVPWLTEMAKAGEMAQWKHLAKVSHHAPGEVVLTERGLLRVLVLCPKPKAAAFRDWLDVELAQENYLRRSLATNDVSLPGFAYECLTREVGATIPSADVYAAYCGWCTARGVEPTTQVALGRWLSTHGWGQVSSHRNGRRWEDMRLRGA